MFIHAQAATDIFLLARRGRVAYMHTLRQSRFPMERDLAMALAIDFGHITDEPQPPTVIVLRDKERNKYQHKCVKKLLGVRCTCLK